MIYVQNTISYILYSNNVCIEYYIVCTEYHSNDVCTEYYILCYI